MQKLQNFTRPPPPPRASPTLYKKCTELHKSIWIKYRKFSRIAGSFVTYAFKYVNDTLGSIYTEY